MMTNANRRYQLLALLLLQARPHSCDLHCGFTDTRLETLKCESYTHKLNAILPKVVEMAVEEFDTILIDSFRKYNWKKIKSLVLKSCNIIVIHPDFFVNASSLIDLDLSDNTHAFITDNSWDHLNKLQSLSASWTIMASTNIANLTNLNRLSIDFPHSTAISFEIMHQGLFIMDGNSKNRKLSINDIFMKINLLTIETMNFEYAMLDLKQIDVINPGIVSLNIRQSVVKLCDRCFENAKGLRDLTISHSGLTQLSEDVFRGAKITYLDLSHNSLTAAALISLTSDMNRVNMSYNIMTNVDHLGNGLPSSLEIFDLSHNSISKLNWTTFSQTPNLISLNLSNNQLSSVSVFCSSVCASVFANLRKLAFLDISNNLIDYIPKYGFEDLTALDSLNLSGNRLRTLDNNIFRNNANLRILLVSNNEIEDLRISSPYHGFPRKLNEIDLSKNRLSYLPIGILFSIDLTKLSVSYNRFTHLSPRFFTTYKQYQYGRVRTDYLFVDMRGNPWKCECLDTLMLNAEDLFLINSYIDVAFTDGRHPSCYAGLEPNHENVCDEAPLSEEDHGRWEEAVLGTVPSRLPEGENCQMDWHDGISN